MGAAVVAVRSGGVEDSLAHHSGFRLLERPADPLELLGKVEELLEWQAQTNLAQRVRTPGGVDFVEWIDWLEEALTK